MKKRLMLFMFLMCCPFLLSSCSPVAENSAVLDGEGVYGGNFHTHTVASDGSQTYHEVVDEAVRLGLDFIVITDHNTISTATSTFCPGEKRLLCVIGEEISTNEGHMLGVGIKSAIPPRLSAQETIERIHAQGGIAIAAHPGEENGGISPENLGLRVGLDAAECTPLKGNGAYNASCAYTPGVSHVYDSDAHTREDLRRIWNRCDLAELSFAGIKEAIRDKRCEVRG
jgi:hypothetical protein